MSRWWNRRRFDLIEMGAMALLVGLACWSGGRAALLRHMFVLPTEAEPLATKYGPGKHSQNEEEWIIRDFFNDRRDGFFVDVGANDYKAFSNTYFLETHLGWSGIAVDPQEGFRRGYETFRPKTRFFAFFVSDVSDERATMYIPSGNSLVASATRELIARERGSLSEVSVPTITLNTLLGGLEVERVDLLSIDVELAEPKVLAGFDVVKFRPSFVCIEAHPETRKQILDYFARHGYVVEGKYLRADTANLYFVPLD